MIEVGEYGRTNLGNIFIFAWLTDIEGKRYENKVIVGNGKTFGNDFYYFDKDEKIVKHSKNIIDLIEVGDYVNGSKIIDIQAGYLYLDKTNPKTELCVTLVDYQIKSIVTKEQFASMEYRLED